MERRGIVIALIAVQAVLLVGLVVLTVRAVRLEERVAGLERQLELGPGPGGPAHRVLDGGGVLPVAEGGPRSGGPPRGALDGGWRPPVPPGAGSRSGGASAADGDGEMLPLADPEAIDVIEQVVEDVWAQQIDERAARREELMEERIGADLADFGSDYDFDDETLDQAQALITDAASETIRLQEDLMRGEIDFAEAERRRRTIREETRRSLEDLLGEEAFDDLSQRILMPGGKPSPGMEP